jgi:hypothetical protein
MIQSHFVVLDDFYEGDIATVGIFRVPCGDKTVFIAHVGEQVLHRWERGY